MPFDVPSLPDLRRLDRDAIAAKLPGSEVAPPNSRLRVLSDRNAGAAYLNFLYLRWLSLQLLPDTAEAEWLDRHAQIWIGGRKAATFAEGSATFTGIAGTIVPASTLLSSAGVEYETTEAITVGSGDTAAPIRALTAGVIGNQDAGSRLALQVGIAGVDGSAVVVILSGGTDVESDEDLRTRVLLRIRQPPMGGDADDYVQWALAQPGVTRAWCAPLEMGMGTVTVRFMMDGLRADADPTVDGFPLPDDVAAVRAALDVLRPVAIKDFFVEAPIPEPISFSIDNLETDSAATRAAVYANVKAMLREKAQPAHAINGVMQPAQTIYREWVSAAILETPGVVHFDLIMDDHEMPAPGYMAVMGTITWL